MRHRSRFGSLQLPVALLGALLTAFAVQQLLTLPPPEGEGFVHGLTMLFLYGLALVGFVTFALGLTIRPGDGYGISFRRPQRLLLFVGVGATLAALLLPLVAFGLLFAAAHEGGGWPVYLWGGLHALGVLAVLGALTWRGIDGLSRRRGGTA